MAVRHDQSSTTSGKSSEMIFGSSEWLTKQISRPPMRSFLKADFCRTIGYILTDRASEHQLISSTDEALNDLLEDLRASFDSIRQEDFRASIKQPENFPVSDKSKITRTLSKYVDNDVLLSWGLLESTKYYLSKKHELDKMTTNQFLISLRDKIKTPFHHSDKDRRLLLLKFLFHLDQLTYIQIPEFSQYLCDNVKRKVSSKQSSKENIFQVWFSKNRVVFAKHGLVVNNPAECYRNISYQLWNDLNTRYIDSMSKSYDQSSFKEVSISKILMCLDPKQWRSKLELVALSGRELGDLDLLYGIKSLVNSCGIFENCWTFPIDLIISNMEAKFSGTYVKFLKHFETQPSRTADQQSLIEFLKCCIELDRLDTHADIIDLLQSSDLKFLFKIYLGSSTNQPNAMIKTAKSRFEEISSWFKTWSFEPSETESTALSIGLHASLAVPTMFEDICCGTVDNSVIVKNEVDFLLDMINLQTCQVGFDAVRNHCKTYEKIFSFLGQPWSDKEQTDFINFSTKNDVKFCHGSDYSDHFIHRIHRNINRRSLHPPNYDEHQQSMCDIALLKAIKFNLKSENVEYAQSLIFDMDNRNIVSDWIKIENKLIKLKGHDVGAITKRLVLKGLIDDIKSSVTINAYHKSRLRYKVLREMIRNCEQNLDFNWLFESVRYIYDCSSGDKVTANPSDNIDFARMLNSSLNLTDSQQWPAFKTISLISKQLNALFHSESGVLNTTLLNDCFRLDLMLLSSAANIQFRRDTIFHTAVTVLDKIKKHAQTLSAENLETFSSSSFLDATVHHIWFGLKDSVIALIFDNDNIPDCWLDALTKIMKQIAVKWPSSIFYEVLANKLDLGYDISDSKVSDPVLGDTLVAKTTSLEASTSSGQTSSKAERSCRVKLKFWNEMYNEIQHSTNHNFHSEWSKCLLSSEMFLKELRRISFLPGEFLQFWLKKTGMALRNLLKTFKGWANPSSGIITDCKRLSECRSKFNLIYNRAMKWISIFDSCLKKTGETADDADAHDLHCLSQLEVHIEKLRQRFKSVKKAFKYDLLEKLFETVTELMERCRMVMKKIRLFKSNDIYTAMISKRLAFLKPSDLVLMPEYYLKGGTQYLGFEPEQAVTVNAVRHSIAVIHSQTAPKKIDILGSDGVSRSFLLKFHEDLRRDRLIMNLFGSINVLLNENKKTRLYNLSLQRYSVTPLSNISGLIQWVKAPSLGNFLSEWIVSARGQSKIAELFQKTCTSIGDMATAVADSGEHDHYSLRKLFYYLLWDKIKDLPRKKDLTTTSSSAQACNFYSQPNDFNTFNYRKELPIDIYVEVMEQMSSVVPKDLISSQIWLNSKDSFHYYHSTREFLRSYATISIVGYIIGLGDRHPGNILLDSKLGRVTLIDYNVSFETGATSIVPEKVPFRLTQNIIYAFGFAGFEGGYKRTCHRVLDCLKDSKAFILHHFNHNNLRFMIDETIDSLTSKQDITSTDVIADEIRLLKMSSPTTSSERLKKEVESKTLTSSNSSGSDACHQTMLEIQRTKLQQQQFVPSSDLLSQEDKPDYAGEGCSKAAAQSQDKHSRKSKRRLLQKKRTGEGTNLDASDSDIGIQSLNEVEPKKCALNSEMRGKISLKRADEIFMRIQGKLCGNDESLLFYPSSVEKNQSESFVPTKSKVEKRAEPGGNLTLLMDELQTTEDQVTALISKAVSAKNKAAMYEGWTAWY